MTDFESLIITNLPAGVFVLIGVVVLWIRLNDINEAIKDIQKECKKRLTWCIDHFNIKQ